MMQLDASGTPQLEYSYCSGVDHPHSLRQANGTVLYYLTDASSNVRALVNGSNQTVNAYEYSPAGRLLSATEPVGQPFHFAGRELDPESQLYYNRARYYDPSLGRFISEDPIGLAGGVNPYVYARNNPVDYTDPSGLEWICAEFSDRTVCTWTDPVQYLAAVHITATANTSGASANFGNRGSGVPGGTTGRSTSGLGGPGVGDAMSNSSPVFSSCQADLAQFSLNFLGNAAGISALKYAAATLRFFRTGAAAEQAAFQMATVPGMTGLSLGVGKMAGTPNPFGSGTYANIYTVVGMIPVIGPGLKLGEAINSCR
ncbi:MAG: RhsA [Gemmatimonadetes bacterium]|nr:RhsA [Gemmatimonadota bacterium]